MGMQGLWAGRQALAGGETEESRAATRVEKNGSEVGEQVSRVPTVYPAPPDLRRKVVIEKHCLAFTLGVPMPGTVRYR